MIPIENLLTKKIVDHDQQNPSKLLKSEEYLRPGPSQTSTQAIVIMHQADTVL